jgi:methionine-S-sulfoxide reductase
MRTFVVMIAIALGGTAMAATADSLSTAPKQPLDTATFAGGCFWCMQPPFEKTPGVAAVTVGYTGGGVPNPSYEDVCTGTTGHAEAVQVVFDPSKVTYRQLLDVFWRNIDPTAQNQQFADRGTQYRTAIFYHGEAQRAVAVKSRDALQASGLFDRPIVTEITPAGPFYAAEKYHQRYYEKQPLRYGMYKEGSGRSAFLKRVWGRK